MTMTDGEREGLRDSAFIDKAKEEGELEPIGELEDGCLLAPPSSKKHSVDRHGVGGWRWVWRSQQVWLVVVCVQEEEVFKALQELVI